jgi:L-fuculose-phosphate aldolase
MSFRSAREQVHAACIELADLGFLAGTGGNFALRVDDGHVAVTPSALDYYAMTPDDVGIVRLSDGIQVEGDRPASVESGLHAAVLRARPGASASVHTHQPIASAYTLLGKPLVVTGNRHRQILGARVPYVEYAPSGTAWLAMRVGTVFETGCAACLMRNHGVVCVGGAVHEATERVLALEAECATLLLEALAPSLPSAVRAPVSALLEAALGPPGTTP